MRMTPAGDYVPIACSLHDELEAAAVRRQVVRVAWSDEGEAREAVGPIRDIAVEDGAEYLVIGEARIRLDRIERFEGQR